MCWISILAPGATITSAASIELTPLRLRNLAQELRSSGIPVNTISTHRDKRKKKKSVKKCTLSGVVEVSVGIGLKSLDNTLGDGERRFTKTSAEDLLAGSLQVSASLVDSKSRRSEGRVLKLLGDVSCRPVGNSSVAASQRGNTGKRITNNGHNDHEKEFFFRRKPLISDYERSGIFWIQYTEYSLFACS